MLPVIAARTLEARKGLRETRPSESRVASSGTARPSREELIRRARSWILENHEPLSPETDLVLLRFGEFPEDVAQATFGESFRGIPLHLADAWVAFQGPVLTDGDSTLCAVAPVPGSERAIISATEAVEAWRGYARRLGYTLEQGVQREKSQLIDPMLVYRYVLDNEVTVVNGTKYPGRFTPTWALDRDWEFCVNAHTGRAWFRDQFSAR